MPLWSNFRMGFKETSLQRVCMKMKNWSLKTLHRLLTICYGISPNLKLPNRIELILEVEDDLGIISQSIPFDMQISVAEKPLTFWQSFLKLQLTPQRWIILGSVLVTGIVLVLAIVLAGKRKNFWREHSATSERRTDPLTQPVPIRQEISRLGNAIPSTYPQVIGQEVTAWLVPLNDRYEALRAKAIPLNPTGTDYWKRFHVNPDWLFPLPPCRMYTPD